jgi:asparagine synthase (glutamine-hydrolysing)
MCGIAGLLDPSGAPVDKDLLLKMVATLAPRGPDGEGIWLAPGVGLGHRRLSVIDLSEAASQPMGSEDGLVQVVFNGEIYNFQELRDELCAAGYRFRSRSDTEVLVHGYRHWGRGLLDRIDGMFAFAIWDARQRRLLAARDRMGKKPLYYALIPRDGGQPSLLAFGSELKALLAIPAVDRRVDPVALGRYLTFEYVPAPHSIVRGARKLDAAEMLEFDASEADPSPRVARYWTLPFPAEHGPRREEDAADELRALLARAVRRRLISDVPLGVFLSGGIDSSTIAACMAEEGGQGRIKSFSIAFADPSFDESAHAARVAAHLGTEHREERLEPRTLIDVLPDVTAFLDEPLGDASIVPTYLLSRFTRRHVTVALGGDGVDELFAGYPTFKAEAVARQMVDRLPRKAAALLCAVGRRAAAALPAGGGYFSHGFKLSQMMRGLDERGPRRHQQWMASFLPEELRLLLTPSLRAQAEPDTLAVLERATAESRARDPNDILMAFYCRFYLAGDINVKVDRAAGAVGLEARAPFLDTEVVKFACGLPPSLRIKRLVTKHILKRAMRGRLPDEIIDRPKHGFAIPVAHWLRAELYPMLREELHPDRLRREGFFDPGYVQTMVDEHKTGRRDHRKQLWTLLVFQRWLDRYRAGS